APAPAAVERRSPRQAEALRALAAAGEAVPTRTLVARGVSREALVRAAERGWAERGEAAPAAAAPPVLRPAAGGGLRLTPEQGEAVGLVARSLDAGSFAPVLLQGVTGSGKTEVYLRAVEEALRRDRGAVVLVPEIGLTPQILGRFTEAFGARVAVLHSGLGERDRRLQWERVRRGEAVVALGARSAVFAPVVRLGLVVVDEEHDASYKQEEGLRYHAKHAALVRARAAGAVALLGSATPDVESFWAAETGRYGRVVLPRRVLGARPPEVRIVDLRQEDARRRQRVLLSEPLRQAVAEALGRGEQALLFLNRRGFSPALVCPSCAEAVRCRACSIALTLHRRRAGAVLLCHYCGHRAAVPEACPGCGGGGLVAAGAGTQRLTEVAQDAWPGARIVRLDRDAARQEGAGALGAIHRGEADVLVGTQMVAKGHHFPRLTVAGVVDADLSLNFPDFRAAERTFQLLTQVAGRAGREERPGLALFQTRNPHQPALTAAARGEYGPFAAAELEARREAGFPPFRRLALLRVSSPSAEEGARAAQAVADAARRLGAGIDVLGPAPAPLERLRGRWRFQVLLRAPGPEPGPLQTLLRRLRAAPEGSPGPEVRLHADVDPVSLL
ncbi:MAG: replication restart helicase PriA, partial [Deferrisomatales bacterium]